MAKRVSLQEKLDNLVSFDQQYWIESKLILGMDEAGRGPLAGPVVAACVIMSSDYLILGVDDSKKVSEKNREILFEAIMTHAIEVGVGIVDHRVIDEINILNATKIAFKQAYEQIKIEPDVIISDYIVGLDIGEYTPFQKGDSKSYSIACASIVAKVTRDRMMREYDKKYDGYGFCMHKGYGTKKHYEAIQQNGICPIHRKSFLKKYI